MNICRQAKIAMMVLGASLVAVGAALPAVAMAENEFSIFANCPLGTPKLNGCLVAKTESGKVILGKKTVPIEHTITIQGGFIENRETHLQTFVPPENGSEALSKTPQTVPGGLLGVVAPEYLPKFLREIINKLTSEGLAGVTATTELAGPVTLNDVNLLGGKGTALTLPVKIKLSNTFLGEDCYVGSELDPITLHLTTGTTSPPKPNEPITGKPGTVTNGGEGAIVIISENSLVDNSFAAPKAEGCGGLLSILIDTAVDAEIGLPSAEGNNTAVLDGTLAQSSRAASRDSRNAIRRSATEEPSPRFHRSNRSATASRSSG